MPKLTGTPPKYRHHKSTCRAVVTIAGKDVFLGKYGSPESRREYDRVVAEWLAAGRPTYRTATDDSGSILIIPLLAEFLRHAKRHYNGGGEYQNFIDVASPLKRLFGRTPAAEFSPTKLKAIREDMIRRGWSRNHINRQMGRVRAIFRWAVGEDLISATVLHALQAVGPLAYGRREDVKESTPVTPIADAVVDDTLSAVLCVSLR